MSEQEIISKYFSHHRFCDDVDIGVGDDAAVVTPPNDSKLVITTDTLNEGIHFHKNCLPEYVGHKALAVNLSDLAAMGANPLWATMNLSVPKIEHEWFMRFSQGIFTLADQYNIKLIGGDFTKGPLSISIQVIGYLDSDRVLTRSGAEVEDLIYVSGTVGDAALGLKMHGSKYDLALSHTEQSYLEMRLERPDPRINLGLEIVKFANAAIDISDGLLIDLKRILSLSKYGAVINVEKIPLSSAVQKQIKNQEDWLLPFSGGEDYEIIFTVNKKLATEVQEISKKVNCPVTEIGKIVQDEGLTLLLNDNAIALPNKLGFDHFT